MCGTFLHMHPNHVAFNPLAEANAGIEALGHDIGQSVADRQIEGNLGILRQKARNGRGQKKIGRWLRCRASNRSPAAVGATERVVRSTSRTPSRSSRCRTISLTRGGDSASCLAALVKLFSSTTATKAVVSARLGPCIGIIPLFGKPE